MINHGQTWKDGTMDISGHGKSQPIIDVYSTVTSPLFLSRKSWLRRKDQLKTENRSLFAVTLRRHFVMDLEWLIIHVNTKIINQRTFHGKECKRFVETLPDVESTFNQRKLPTQTVECFLELTLISGEKAAVDGWLFYTVILRLEFPMVTSRRR